MERRMGLTVGPINGVEKRPFSLETNRSEKGGEGEEVETVCRQMAAPHGGQKAQQNADE